MAAEDPRDLERIDQEIRINELKEEAREIAGGEMASFESSDAPPEVLEQFWKNVVDFEKAPVTSHYEQLSQAGLEFPPPEEMSDEQLHEKLWDLIHALAKRNTFLYQTDHLSDRELYTHLVEESLHEMGPELPEDFGGGGGWACTIDLLGGCSEEDIAIGHTYYSDDEERAHWMKDFPDYEMPERKPKPYDRDRLLPIDRAERERRKWLAGLEEKGYSKEDIERLFKEEAFDDDGNPLLEPGCGGRSA